MIQKIRAPTIIALREAEHAMKRVENGLKDGNISYEEAIRLQAALSTEAAIQILNPGRQSGPMLRKALEGLENVLNKYKKEQEAKVQDGFIYVPSINLYVAKERTLQGKTWPDTHAALQAEGLKMPTIPEFIVFVNYLKHDYKNRHEADSILDEIYTVRDPWRAEWLDAKFEKKERNFLC